MRVEHAEGARVYAELRGKARAAEMQELAHGIGAEAVIAGLSLEFIFGKVWSRGGLDRKQRSLVTIAVLVALRQTAELQNHFRIGLTNGLTQAEIEEAIVQTAPYAGFPAAWTAARALIDVTCNSKEAPDQEMS
ncbi:carboxymuconolactone decarboxylase family protein [Gluconacetobacter azotocaptans]|uniref:Carboxymuconolactone decarboxylase family protein n=1 Tax=Gluconacetobacter azotocaptans TaxID=142834 RepID=A0A7W4PEH5_9PROT|nr:carboxymuconolactone decarboxylase family protein [Gluconacetobacter azotocaptans]MBB2190768.1 carboxymuconolactone decarboxylase family protein [Gluconacetobacter azotocaptans]GBQ30717.1 4-carboxymuconolactone decarboxylase [Gluconacetobacter azotocaptans DSM 13594]